MFQVEKDMIISDVINNAPDTVPLFQAIGMHCIGCAMASGESVSEACEVHGVDADLFVDKLNEFIAAQK